MSETAVVLVNLGTPNSPNPSDVKKYLIEFLTDKRVIDQPWLKRQLLVRGIIVPRRYRDSSKAYKRVWTEEGSPLLSWGKKTKCLLQESLGDDFQVELAMRYQSPSIEDALSKVKGCKHLIVIPLFPQYASATSGSVTEKVMHTIKDWECLPKLSFIGSYPDHPLMIDAFCQQAKETPWQNYDQVLFSFHGLPVRQANKQPYEADCRATASAIVKKLKIPNERWSLTFQSRLGNDPWLEPFTQDKICELGREGKKILVFSPSFVCDCLETTDELGYEYRNEFIELGGKRFDVVPGLNANPLWIQALRSLVLSTY
ncbi:MAG: ferrochelatase [Waddliaceae bacterium]